MIRGRIVELFEQGGSIVHREEISRTTVERFHPGTGVGKTVDQTEGVVSTGKADAAHHFSELVCGNTLKVKCAGGDGAGERERISRPEGGASIVMHVIGNNAKRFG